MNELELDLRGLKCPLPVLKAIKAIRPLEDGAMISLRADDPLAAIDIPNFCREHGHRLIEQKQEADCLFFRLEKHGESN